MKHSINILGILLVTALLDGVLKYIALAHFPTESAIDLSPVVAFVLHKNPGIAFNLALPMMIVVPATCVILVSLAYHAHQINSSQPRAALGMIAVIIGALGNLVDRIVNGFTTDYLMFFSRSIINLSDILIILGAGAILVYYTHNPHQRRA